MSRTQIRIPQLKGESLPASSAEALKFTEQGGNDNYLTFDTQNTDVEIGSAAVNILLNGELSGNAVDTDTTLGGGSASDVAVASQLAIKTYVDAQITAQDLDFAGDSGTGAVDLDSQSLTVAGGVGLESTAANQTVTIDLSDTAVSAAAYGSALGRQYAHFTVDAQGRLTAAASADIPLASTGDTGLASFAAADFAVSNAGEVTIDAGAVSNAQIANSFIEFAADSGSAQQIALGASIDLEGTANEIETAVSAGKVTIGLPDDVEITNDLLVNGKLTVVGDVSSLSSSEVVNEDASLALGVPGGLLEGTFDVISVGTNNDGRVKIFVDGTIYGSLNNGARVYVVDLNTTDFGSGNAGSEKILQENGGYVVSNVANAGQSNMEFEITTAHGIFSDTSANASVTGAASSKIFVSSTLQNAPISGTGLQFPAVEPVSWQYNNTSDRMVLYGADSAVDSKNFMVLGGANNLGYSFVEQNSSIQICLSDDLQNMATPANKQLRIPVDHADEDTFIVSVAGNSAGLAASSSTGRLTLDPDNGTDRTGVTLSGSDTLIANADSSVGKITIQQIADFMGANAGSVKLVGSSGSLTIAGAGALSAGDAYPASPGAGTGLPELPADFRQAGADTSKHEFYLNGMLLVRGPDADISGGASPSGDYQFDTDAGNSGAGASLAFAFDLEVGDILQFVHRP